MNLELIVKRHKKWMLSLITISLIIALLTSYRPFFFGYSLGALFSIYSLWLLARKVRAFADKAVQGKSARSLATVSRMAIAIIAVFFALKNPETFNVYGVISGLMTSYIVIIIDYFIYIKNQSGEER